MRFTRRLAIILVGVALAAISFHVHLSFAQNEQQRELGDSIKDTVIAEEQFENWRYTAYRGGSQITLKINVMDTLPRGIEAFKATSDAIASTLVQQQEHLDVSVVLNRPISLDELHRLTVDYGLQVKSTYSEIITANGQTGTLYVIAKGEDFIPKAIYERAIRAPYLDSDTESDLGTFQGIIMVEAVVPSTHYTALSASDAVFMVDVTPSFSKLHMQQNHSPLLNEDDIVQTSAFPVYWYIE